jgi:hypothetical protein
MNGSQVEAAWDDSAEAKGRPSFGQLAMGLVPPLARTKSPEGIERVRALVSPLPPGLANQIERAATQCAAAPDGDVLYAACWCDDRQHAEADSTAWRTTRERAERDQLQALGPESHLIRQIQITEVIA